MHTQVAVKTGDEEVIVVDGPHSTTIGQPERVDLGHRWPRRDSRVFDGSHDPFLAGHVFIRMHVNRLSKGAVGRSRKLEAGNRVGPGVRFALALCSMRSKDGISRPIHPCFPLPASCFLTLQPSHFAHNRFDRYVVTPHMAKPALTSEMKKGSAELLILALLEDGQRHGYEIAQQIERRSRGAISFHVASLYPTLYRMEDKGLIDGRWVEKAGQRRRCYYRITDSGRTVLAEQREDWSRFVAALGQIAGVKYA